MVKKLICKKLIYLGIILALLFSLAACNSLDNLSNYKADAKDRLSAYTVFKGESNYTEGNWVFLLGLAEQGKMEIDARTNRDDIESVVKSTKSYIDDVWPILKNEPVSCGTFYGLQDAYNDGFLTSDDLCNIAYYVHNESEYSDWIRTFYWDILKPNGFESIPKSPAVLSQETENAIKETVLFDAYNNKNSLAPAYGYAITQNITIHGYYGTYNGNVIIDKGDIWWGSTVTTIADVTIVPRNGNAVIYVWVPNQNYYDKIQKNL